MAKRFYALVVVLIGCFVFQCSNKSGEPEIKWSEVGDPLSGEVGIVGGDHFAVLIKASGEMVPGEEVDPLAGLTESAESAIDLSPEWIQEELGKTLVRLSAENQDILAAEISAVEEKLLDEVTWAIAVTDSVILDWMIEGEFESIFRINAKAIYDVDEHVKYANLVELSGQTTLEVVGEDGTYELEPEEYYWYVVYPRSYFELPMLEDGAFWRAQFQTDVAYGATVVEAVVDATTLREGAKAVGVWIQEFMTVEYGSNETYPMEVYLGQRGSCGQYAIITTAAARTVLVPAVSVSSRSNDHEWNELWDGRWISWDNNLGDFNNGVNPQHPYIDMPGIYDDDMAGGRGTFGELAQVYRFFGNGRIEASDLYTSYEDVITAVVDGDGHPVEGAHVVARRGGTRNATWGSTDHRGEVVFKLGDDNAYAFTVTHDLLGEIGGQAVAVSQGGGPYDSPAEFEKSLPRGLEEGEEFTDQDHLVTVDFSVIHTRQREINDLTRGYELGITHPRDIDGGVLDVFLVRADEFEAFTAGESFTAHGVMYVAEEGPIEVQVPMDEDWYVVFDNTWWSTSEKKVTFDVQLSVRDE